MNYLVRVLPHFTGKAIIEQYVMTTLVIMKDKPYMYRHIFSCYSCDSFPTSVPIHSHIWAYKSTTYRPQTPQLVLYELIALRRD